MTTRAATAEDAAALAAIHVASWRAAYAGLMPDSLLDGLDATAFEARWSEAPSGDERAWASERDEELVGFVVFGSSRDTDAQPTTGEVLALYVAPDHWGTGEGWELHARAIAELTHAGFRDATLWVLESNARARRFYERQGWAWDGVQKEEVVRGAPLTEVRYRRSLT